MKHLLILFVALASISTSSAQTVQVGSVNYFLSGSKATVMKGNYNGAIAIPGEISHEGRTYQVEAIAYGAFENSKELMSVILPNSIKVIGGRAFENCPVLNSVNIPSSVNMLGNGVFFKCSTLTEIHLPANLDSIGEYAFSVCSSLRSITIDPKNPHFTSVDGVLYNKNMTTLIKVPETKKSFHFPPSVTSFLKEAFENCRYLEVVEIPEKITVIPGFAFQFCSLLRTVNIHKNITSIGLFTFAHCPSLEAFHVEFGNQHYSSVDGILYNYDQTRLIRCPEAKTSATLSKNTTFIESWAFMECGKLTELVLPEKLERIGWLAFNSCTSLKTVRITSVKPPTIADEAFSSIRNTVTIWVPAASLELYKKSPSLQVKELNYKTY